jgi:putative transcriptional regulator
MRIKLQEILDNKNISIYSLSKDIGVAQNNLSKIVKGETTSIKYDILEKLCNILDITPNDMFEIEPQLTLFNYNNKEQTIMRAKYPIALSQRKFKGSREATQIKESLAKGHSQSLEEPIDYNSEEFEDPTNSMNKEELAEYTKSINEYHSRLNVELETDELVSKFIDKLIDFFTSSFQLDTSIKQILTKYKGHDYFTTNLKVDKFYKSLYRFLAHYSDDESFIKTLNNIRNIYQKGGLEKLSDKELKELKNDINFYVNDIKKD